MADYINTHIIDDAEDNDERCDLDPSKICDNCCKCLETDDKEYRTVMASFLTEDTLIERVSDGAEYIPIKRIHGDYSTLPAVGRRRR